MGYETRMWICTNHIGSDFYHPIAMIELCKCGDGPFQEYNQRMIQVARDSLDRDKAGLYNTDGDTKRYTDPYDDPLAKLDPKTVIELMEVEDSSYRRFEIATNLIESILKVFPEERVICITEGY